MPRVVVAENDRALAHLLEEILGGEGFDVVSLPSGSPSDGISPDTDADLAIVDFGPGRAGRDTSARIIGEMRKRAAGRLPIIGVTADHQLLRRAGSRFAALPGFAFVGKPFSIDELLDVVGVMLHLGDEGGLFDYLDGLTAGVLVADSHRRYLHANPAALDRLGYDLDAFRKLQITDVLAASPRASSALWSRFVTERGAGSARYELRHRDGHEVAVEMHASVLSTFEADEPIYLSWLRPARDGGASLAGDEPRHAVPA